MKRTIFCLLGALALLVGMNLTPAPAGATPPGYFYLAPNTPTMFTYHGCRLEFTYGQFGNLSFARVAYVDGLCSTLSGAKVYAWGDQSSFCTWYIEDNLNPSDCDAGFDGNARSFIQATANGSLLAGSMRIVYNGSVELDFSPFP